jgi:hypothetical protein
MVASLHRHRLILPIAPVFAGALGLLTALTFALLPMRMIEQASLATGFATMLPAAAPPLGITARIALILGGGAAVTAILWAALYLAVGTRALALTFGNGGEDADEVPMLLRADAHPDAPARRPLSAARDLGEPIEEEADEEPIVQRAIPDDLDQPLSAYDPAAIRPVPAEPVRPVEPLVKIERPQTFDASERMETFPLVPPAPEPHRARPEATIHALLDRLEQGVARREQPLPVLCAAATGARVDEALGALRSIASVH